MLLPATVTAGRTSQPAILDSVKPVQWATVNVDEDSGEETTGPISNHCSAGKISNRGFWLTAAHCLASDETRYVDGHEALIVSVDRTEDLGILYVPTAPGTPLKLATHSAGWYDELETAGYSFGFYAPFYFRGHVARPTFVFPDRPQTYVIWDMPCAGGQSGSPVLDASGKLVSVLQIGFGQGFSTICGGATYGSIRAFAGSYFGG
jgi:hypothetical protein